MKGKERREKVEKTRGERMEGREDGREREWRGERLEGRDDRVERGWRRISRRCVESGRKII